MLVRFRIPEIVLGALLTVAVFAMGYVVGSWVPPPSQQIEKADHLQTANEGAERTAEKQIAYYTKWLAWFTGALVAVSGIQGYFLLRADKTARIAANAAQKSATAAVNVDLPILVLRQIDLRTPTGAVLNVREQLLSDCEPKFSFINVGRSVAQITAGCLEWCIASGAKHLPKPPKYENILPYAPGSVVVTQAVIPLDVPCKITLTADQLSALNASQQFLFVYGYIAFNDFLGKPHEVRFCTKWAIFREGEKGPFGFVWDHEIPKDYTKTT
jgi:hypothetical protein